MPERATTIQTRWIQLVGLPLLLVLFWVVAGAVRQVVFLFMAANRVDDYFTVPHGQPGRTDAHAMESPEEPPAAATR